MSALRRSTCVTYEETKMLEHRSIWDPNHPERPERLSAVLARCRELGLLDRCEYIPPRPASDQELALLHDQSLIDALQTVCSRPDLTDNAELQAPALKYDTTYFHPSTNAAARFVAGSVIELITKISTGSCGQNGMALTRPPGHHAMQSEHCGYCFFNNAAIGAAHALENKLAERILIVDFDVHHGQGTQQLFYDDPRVLYFSTHHYEHGLAWPNLKESNCDWIGSGKGRGFNCNVPLNKIGMGNSEFLTIWHSILIPMAYQFNPDLVIVSAGFDAALNDPLGEMQMSPQCYPHLVTPLLGLAGGKVAVIMEGGYCLRALAEGAALVLRTLLGDPCPLIKGISNPMQEITETIHTVATIQKPYWPILASCIPRDGEHNDCVLLSLPALQYIPTEPIVNTVLDACPVNSFEGCSKFDNELEELIRTTNLSFPSERVVRVESGRVEIFLQLLERIHQNEIMSGVGVLPNEVECGKDIAEKITEVAFNKWKRVFVVTLESDCFDNSKSQDERGINIFIAIGGEEIEHEQITIHLRPDSGDTECLAVFTHLIFPMAYEFSPDFVIFGNLEESVGKVTPEATAHFTNFIRALANGRILTLAPKNVAELQLQVVDGSRGLPRLHLKETINESTTNEIIGIRKELAEGQWTTLRSFCYRLNLESKFDEQVY